MAAHGGIHVTEFGSADVNPQPIVIEETDELLEEYLSPTKLKALTGVENLEEVTFLEMKVDSSETSLGNFGIMLPNLKQLKLNNSLIATVRDLGTSLEKLRVLWMARCCLCDLDGISSMSSLQELYLAYNDIHDISPVSMLENLQLLDIEGNNITDTAQVEFLGLCPKLSTLSLEGNPVCLAPNPGYSKEKDGDYDYRAMVKRSVPHLKILDDEPVDNASSSLLGTMATNLSTDWLMVNEAIKDSAAGLEINSGNIIVENRLCNLSFAVNLESLTSDPCGLIGSPAMGRYLDQFWFKSTGRPGSARPSSASRRRPGSSSGKRPGTGVNRPGSGYGARPTTSGGSRPKTAGEALGAAVAGEEDEDDTSALTHGSGGVICGNPVRALRDRRKRNKAPVTFPNAPNLFTMMQHQPEHSYEMDGDEDDGKSREDVFSELRAWKAKHEKKLAERLKDSEPQVLKIDHDDNDSSSDGGEDLEPNNNYRLIFSSTKSRTSTDDEDTGCEVSPTSVESPDLMRVGSAEEERIPTPPKQRQPTRPKTASDFRSKRFRRQSSEEAVPVRDLQKLHIAHGSDVVLEDSGHLSPSMLNSNFASPPPLPSIDERPFSGPVVGSRKFKSDQPVQPKIIDNHKPVIRTATQTPPNLAQRLSSSLARPATAKAVLQRQVLSRKNTPPFSSM